MQQSVQKYPGSLHSTHKWQDKSQDHYLPLQGTGAEGALPALGLPLPPSWEPQAIRCAQHAKNEHTVPGQGIPELYKGIWKYFLYFPFCFPPPAAMAPSLIKCPVNKRVVDEWEKPASVRVFLHSWNHGKLICLMLNKMKTGSHPHHIGILIILGISQDFHRSSLSSSMNLPSCN